MCTFEDEEPTLSFLCFKWKVFCNCFALAFCREYMYIVQSMCNVNYVYIFVFGSPLHRSRLPVARNFQWKTLHFILIYWNCVCVLLFGMWVCVCELAFVLLFAKCEIPHQMLNDLWKTIFSKNDFLCFTEIQVETISIYVMEKYESWALFNFAPIFSFLWMCDQFLMAHLISRSI